MSSLNGTDNGDSPNLMFSWIDLTLFCGMLGSSALIGVYFGCFGSKQSTAKEYLLGGKKMKILPISMSLLASNISGITLLAVPADIYRYGACYINLCLTIVPVSLLTAYVYLPVFHKLQLTSSFEYLKERFSDKVRTAASVIFTVSLLIYNPIVIYIPALAFAQATGLDVHLITPFVCIICIFYTTIGGLKAVVWTDALQIVCILISSTIVFVLGIISVGGVSNVYEKSLASDRLNIFNFNPNPTARDTFWTIFIGTGVSWTFFTALLQSSVQRFMSLPSLKEARQSVVYLGIGTVLIQGISVLTGLLIYTKYAECDPLKAGLVERPDQMLTYYIMDVARSVPGLPGIFTAGIFSAALSTLSTTLNSAAATIYEDFVSPFMTNKASDEKTNRILKAIVVIFGMICTALVFGVEHLGSILPLSITLSGTIFGPLMGLFNLGMLVPFANSKGALVGSFTGLATVAWMAIGAQYYSAKGIIKHPTKSFSTEGCDFIKNNITTVIAANNSVGHEEMEQPLYIYRISFFYYCAIGFLLTVLVGSVVSWFTKQDNKPVNRDLLSPVIYPLLSKSRSGNKGSEYYTISKALEITYNKE